MEGYKFIIITSPGCPACIELKQSGNLKRITTLVKDVALKYQIDIEIIKIRNSTEFKRSPRFIKTRIGIWVPIMFFIKNKYYERALNMGRNDDVNPIVRNVKAFNFDIGEIKEGKLGTISNPTKSYGEFKSWMKESLDIGTRRESRKENRRTTRREDRKGSRMESRREGSHREDRRTTHREGRRSHKKGVHSRTTRRESRRTDRREDRIQESCKSNNYRYRSKY